MAAALHYTKASCSSDTAGKYFQTNRVRRKIQQIHRLPAMPSRQYLEKALNNGKALQLASRATMQYSGVMG